MNIQPSKEFLERIQDQIEQRLLPRGFRKTKHQVQTHTQGNLYTVFEDPGHLVRFIWNGKDRRIVLRIYRKRTWLMRLAKVLIGRNDDEKLLNEFIISREELSDMSEEQVMEKCLELLKPFQ